MFCAMGKVNNMNIKGFKSKCIFSLTFQGTTLPTVDQSGNYPITALGVPTITNDATRGNVLSTSGNSCIQINRNINLNVCTISFWYYYQLVNNLSLPVRFVSCNDTNIFAVYWSGFGWQYTNNKYYMTLVVKSSEYSFASTGNLGFSPNTWRHLCITLEQDKVTGYVDGVSCVVGGVSNTAGMLNNLTFGGLGSNNQCLTGYMDNIRIYTGVLNATSVSNLYNYERLNPLK